MADDRAGTDPAVIVSCDTHVGPLLEAQLRGYCPKRHLADFDDFVAEQAAVRARTFAGSPEFDEEAVLQAHPNLMRPGHHDVHERLRDLDHDGIAAEVIFHFSQNGELFPFMPDFTGGLSSVPAEDFELAKVGFRIYNRWLADFVSVEPARHVGLAYVPTWDVEAATAEVEWARDAGLRGVNFPPPGRPGHLSYNHPAWEPFWSACESLDMALTTHSSGAHPIDYESGPGGIEIMIYESGGWLGRRAVWWLIHGRVFERHPGLKLVVTEQYEGWFLPTLRELDAVYARFGRTLSGDPLPRLPSEYAMDHVFLGASFMSAAMAHDAWREGYAANVIWGSDYPHVEGTFQHLDDPDAEPVTRLALRRTLSGVPRHEALLMAGLNGVRVYGLDGEELARVAARIRAPTADDLATPPSNLPTISARSNAFRGQAGTRSEDLSELLV
jgi:predicted TIM-barrel fold metal-dependent hydrolase